MENNKNRNHGGGDGNLGVNKMGKNIRKSPLHQTNFGNNGGSSSSAAAAAVISIASRPSHPQPQVYNISKNDFRDVVQQLTGSPSLHNATPPRPPQNSSKPQSMRLQKIRPPPLTPINRPPLRPPVPAAPAPAEVSMVPYNNNNGLSRPAQFGQPGPNPPLQHPGEMTWANTAESPISAYMRILQNSMMDPGSKGNQVQPQFQPHPPQQPHGNVHQIQQQNPHQPPPPPPPVQGNAQPPNPASSALLPNPHVPPMMPSPRFNGPQPPMNTTNPPVPSFPSPTSQFLLSSPTGGYMSFLSPRSPYPLLSPGVQFPTPLTPNFPFSPFGQPGLLGPGPQTPVSPGLFPLSPSGFFQMASPRWRDP
ncbi:hypothetical protein PIB30_072202 [Stylosanthes scabra]|uniref:VQ domain-containing protein n=1 Tax=Stylosanthes scabra TaxID=79078 RepID=A0ABU6QQ37_9FABA|nr:hypothetical protein [Stylosanthes scabra]